MYAYRSPTANPEARHIIATGEDQAGVARSQISARSDHRKSVLCFPITHPASALFELAKVEQKHISNQTQTFPLAGGRLRVVIVCPQNPYGSSMLSTPPLWQHNAVRSDRARVHPPKTSLCILLVQLLSRSGWPSGRGFFFRQSIRFVLSSSVSPYVSFSVLPSVHSFRSQFFNQSIRFVLSSSVSPSVLSFLFASMTVSS